ncbi:hypothetical protein ACLBKS_03340 [Hylemonella sp. W303a]|uniref:hypothetical protein n=1 Tax=Hylemonella sp. W303a TaxID=3389873 RepID=UPI00396B2104
MVDPIYSDVAVTWIGAAGCAVYAHFLWQIRRSSSFARAALFLFVLLALLLLIRGFFWTMPDSMALGRTVLGVATLLPVAMTIFSEHLLRRHHPLSLKLGALAVSAVFFVINLIFVLPVNLPLLIAFLCCFVVVLAWNGWQLVRHQHSELTRHEVDIARATALVVLLSLPLVMTDFREEVDVGPMRLGALAPLLLVHVLLHLTHTGNAAIQALLRLATLTIAAATLSFVFGLVAVGFGPPLPATWLGSLPVAMAWVLLASSIVQARRLQSEVQSQNFLNWLLHARMDNIDGFLASLRQLPLTGESIVLRASDLAAYDTGRMLAMTAERDHPMSAGEARTLVRTTGDRLDAAEQWLDLFERHHMTHALIVARDPALIILLNLPQSGSLIANEVRAGVIQRVARRIAEEKPHAH